jgi:trigger factor
MDFTIKELAKSQLEINFVLTPEDLKPYLEQALNDIARNASVAGYRPGKAPANLIKDKVDPVALLEEGAEKAIRDIWPKTAEEQQIDGVGTPKVEITKIVPNNNLEFRVTVDILPKIELPDLKSVLSPLGKERISSKVEKKEIEDSLNWLADSRAITTKVERGAQEGDSVNVNFKTFNEGKELTESQADNYPLVLGKGHFLEGFEKELIGLKAGEEKNFSVIAPTDYWEENLRGKKLDFQVKVNEVSERKLPLVDDEFAKTLGKFENLETLKKSIEDGIRGEKDRAEGERLRVLILKNISDQVKLDVPKSLIEGELNAMIHNLRHQCEDHGLSFEDYLKQLKKTEEEMRKDLSVGASSKAKADLILRAISKEQKFSANEDEINVAVAELLHSMGGEISELNNEEVKLYAKEMVIRRKTWDYLESFLPQEGVKVTPETTTQVPKDMV